MLIISMAAQALASPGAAGAVHLGATPVEPGSAWAGTGALALWGGGFNGLPVVDAGAALGKDGRGAFNLLAGYDGLGGTAPAWVSVRHNVIQRDALRFGITGQFMLLPVLPDGTGWFAGNSPGDVMTWTSPGVVLEGGGDKVWMDLSLPVWGVATYNGFFGPSRTPFPMGGTAGVNVALGDHQRFRFGAPELFSWHLRTDHVYVDVGGVTILVAGAVWAKVGVIF